MPYCTQDEIKAIERGEAPKTVGQMNYVITKRILDTWNANPCYNTLASLAKRYLNDNAEARPRNASYDDWHMARILAFWEFYRRVGVKYETVKMVMNGDLPEYRTAEEHLKKLMSECKSYRS